MLCGRNCNEIILSHNRLVFFSYIQDTYTSYVTVTEFISNGFILIFVVFVASFMRFVCLQNHYHIVIVQALNIRAAVQVGNTGHFVVFLVLDIVVVS